MKLKSLQKRIAELEARGRIDRSAGEPTEREWLALAILRHDMRIERGAELTDEILAELKRRLEQQGSEVPWET